jgi:DNA mismatch repair protein MutS2
MGSESIRLENLIQRLAADSEVIEKSREEAEQSYTLARQAQEKWVTTLETLERERREILNKAAQEAKDTVDAARKKADRILAQIQNADVSHVTRMVETLKQDSRKLKNQMRRPRPIIPPLQETLPSPQELTVGQLVYIPSLDQKGTILQLDKDKKIAQLQVGTIKLEIPTSRLVPLEKSRILSKPDEEVQHFVMIESSDDNVSRGEIALAGKPVAVALEDLDKFLDKAVVAGLSQVSVIHGIGTGKLKAAIHKMLSTHPLVSSFTTAENYEGLTLVKLGL